MFYENTVKPLSQNLYRRGENLIHRDLLLLRKEIKLRMGRVVANDQTRTFRSNF